MTSWAGIGVRDREWGVLGKPEGFRVPYKGADGIVAVFPRLENGGFGSYGWVGEGGYGEDGEETRFCEVC
jgi:hypothetical protein